MGDFYGRARHGAAARAVLALLAGWSPNLPATAATAATTTTAAPAVSPEIEVFHFLDPRADVPRVATLRSALQPSGYAWKDFTVAGGWTGRGETILRLRVQAHNPPAAAMMKTPFMQHWAARDALVPLDEVAAAQRWDELLPKAIADSVKFKGRYYAVPLNIHRVNWLWINERMLKETGTPVPQTWAQFFDTAEAMKRLGYTAVAHYGRDTQNLLLFETIALGVGGPAFHRKALVEYDADELRGPVMQQVLATYRRIKDYTEQPANSRIAMERGNSKFETGKVGMHLMGDWANPAFYPEDKAAPFKFVCVPAPDSAGSFLLTADSLAMFRSADPATLKGQLAFAAGIMSAPVQQEYSVRKGSIPARGDTGLKNYHGCSLKSAAAFRAAELGGTIVPAISMTASRAVEDGIQEVITEFWNNDGISIQQAAGRLVTATRRR